MARYGIDFYGTNVYGAPSFIDFDATPLEVLPYAPAQNAISWTIPDGQYTRLRLVRNAYGWPVHEDDGRVLLDLNSGPAASAPVDAPANSYLDIDLQAGRLYYYSIFVRAYDSTLLHDEWRRAADGTGISIGQYNYTERLVDLLPEAYWSDPNDPSGRNDQLVRFLSIFGTQLDQIRSQYESLRDVHNPDKIAAALLGPLGDMFGVQYEPEIGARQHRAMVRNAVYINRRKGTALGTNTLVTSFTGWDAKIDVGVNLMLDYNDSSFEEIIGRWESGIASSTVGWRATDGAVAAYQASDFTNKQAGLLQITTNAGSSYAVLGLRHPITSGIPVNAGAVYTLSGYIRSAVTPRAIDMKVRWHDARGAVISDSSYGTAVTSTTSGWTRASVTATAPTGTVYAGLLVRVNSAGAGEVHYLDAMQFELGASATTFQEARDIRITLHADRINQAINPSAEVDLTGWGVPAQSTLVRDTSVAFSGDLSSTAPTSTVGTPNVASFRIEPVLPANNLYPDPSFETGSLSGSGTGAVNAAVLAVTTAENLVGTHSLSVTSASTGIQDAVQLAPASGTNVTAGTTISGAVWVKAATGVQIVANMRALDSSSGAVLGTGPSYNATGNGAWQRLIVPAFTYATSGYRPSLRVGFNTIGAGQVMYIDVPQIQAAAAADAWPASTGQAFTAYGLMPIIAGEDYTGTAYVYGPTDCRPTMGFYSSDGTLLQATDGLTFTAVTGSWTRVDVTATAPDGAYYANFVVSALWANTVNTRLWFDQVLFERTAEIRPYFDASQFHTRPADYLWEGTAHASRSHYYLNRVPKQFRLDALLNDYLLPGHTHTLLLAQPFVRAPDQPNEDSSGSYGNGPYGDIPYAI